jgi:hypothetical protein
MLVKALAIKTFIPKILNAGFDCRIKHFTQQTSCSGILLEKLKVSRTVMNFPSYYETQKFMTVFTKAQYWFPFNAKRICPHSSPIFTEWSLLAVQVFRPKLHVYP